MEKLYALFIVLALYSIAPAQPITWTDITSTYSLPQGVKLVKGVRTSPALVSYYLDVDLNRKNLAIKPYLTPSGSERINTFVTRYNAIAGVNGGYFGGTSMYSAIIQPNAVLAKNIASVTRPAGTYYTMRGLFGITETRDMAVNWIYHFGNTIRDVYVFSNPLANTQSAPAPIPVQSNGVVYNDLMVGVGGGPVLIKDGQIRITYDEEVFFGSGIGTVTDLQPRTAIGYTTNKHVIIIVADGRQTASAGLSLTELAQVLSDLGCVEALNLDGGGSTQMAIGNTFVDVPSEARAVPSMLAVVSGDSVPFLPPIKYKKIIDTESPDCVYNSNEWNPSTVAGYYGTSPALVAKTSVTGPSIKFKPNVPLAGKYDVYAWWTASGNRWHNTPYIITRAGGIDTVKVDQSVDGTKWNKLGSYNFTASLSDEIRIEAKAPASDTGLYVSVDALRILQVDSLAADVKGNGGLIRSEELELLPNYPNPFNPGTTIEYRLPKEGNVSIVIYNALGQRVISFPGMFHKAGSHSMYVDFSRFHLPSGMYIMQLRCDSAIKSRQMVYIK
ncbi:MAG: phosphodiester glycosidase family protein [Ignavibacteria bacterium]|nr:phosphodiester glycosidase family protein [Ignavibacteria bacterium]